MKFYIKGTRPAIVLFEELRLHKDIPRENCEVINDNGRYWLEYRFQNRNKKHETHVNDGVTKTQVYSENICGGVAIRISRKEFETLKGEQVK